MEMEVLQEKKLCFVNVTICRMYAVENLDGFSIPLKRFDFVIEAIVNNSIECCFDVILKALSS